MSRHEREIQEIIQHFNTRLSEMVETGTDLTAFERKLLHKLNMYTSILTSGNASIGSFSSLSVVSKHKPIK